MKAEDTLQKLLDFYPEIFPTRKHALDHLFCTIGNGFEWKDGELISDDELFEDNDCLWNRYSLNYHIKYAKGVNEDLYWASVKLHKDIKELDSTHKIPLKYQFEWYELSKKYSYLYNYPENIKDDWMKILEETKEYLKEDGIEV